MNPAPIALPGVDQEAAAALSDDLAARKAQKVAFRSALFTLGRSEHRRTPLTPAQKERRRAAGRRARLARRVSRAAA